MNYQAESNAVEIKRLRDCYAELSKLHQADRRLDEQRIDTLRARVAELEAALREILPVDDDPVWGLRDDHPIHRELGTLRAARAALGAGKETP